MTVVQGHIRFATDILRRLGEELNPSIDQGILELVKNAYDADALNCVVRINIDDDNSEDSITVEDDGVGMATDDILSGWLVLGSSGKSTSNKTKLGRVPAGNKGLGRLAALRLGTSAELITKPEGSDRASRVTLDWNKFDDVSVVDEVSIPIEDEDAPSTPMGTTITVRNLRKKVGRMEVKRLARSMILLADPFGDVPTGFKPILRAPAFDDLEKLVSDRYFHDAEYHLVAKMVDGVATAEVQDWRGNILFQAAHNDLSRSKDAKSYRAPDATFELWSFSLNGANFVTRSTSLSEVREWLDVFGGVHVYSNSIRVAPYGNSGMDWLDMNVARARSPEERPSTNNSIGRVNITDPAGILEQKTDRSGFIETDQFDELRRFAIDSLEWMARRRLSEAEQKRQQNRADAKLRTDSTAATVKEQIDKAPDSVKADLNLAFDQYAAARDRETDALRREVQLYRTLSTAGITTATFAHESNGGPIKVIVQSVNAIERRGQVRLGVSYETSLKAPVESIRKATQSLSVLSQATLRLVDQDKRRIGRVELHPVIEQMLDTFAPFLEGRDVTVEKELATANPYLRGAEAAIESVITNLINNSLAAFEHSTAAQRTLKIATSIDTDKWTLTVSDNGPGIEGIGLREIWLPGQTRRQGGTGLGLTIVRDAVSDMSGTVEAQAHGELGGATFVIRLPILGV